MSDQLERAKRLGLHGLAARLEEGTRQPWAEELLQWEESARQQRSLDRRLKVAGLGRFKAMADFNWSHPTKIDRILVEDLFSLEFIKAGLNIIIAGPNGVGKTMIARNLAHAAVVGGASVQYATASAVLGELAAEDSASALERRLRQLTRPTVLALDEVGYFSYGNRHADLLFEIVSRRYEKGRPMIITTNRSFQEWKETFPNSSCVVTLVDRLIHRCEVVKIEGPSFRETESMEQREERSKERSKIQSKRRSR